MSDILQTALRYLEEDVRPKAQAIDRDPEALRDALRGLCNLELMALKRPASFGGPGLAESEFRTFQEEVARASGSLAFLQTQHQSAVSMLSKSENEGLKLRYLPHMANGEKLVGIGFSQLRRPGEPMMRAKAVDGGYELSGTVPWITGWSFYPEFLVGATLKSGEALFAVVPLENRSDKGSISVSEPMRLAAMETAMTVSAEFQGWFVPDNDVAFIRQADWIRNNDLINIALQGHFAIGCALAGMDVLKSASDKRGLPFLKNALDELHRELEDCRAATAKAQLGSGEEVTTDERLKVRAWAIDLAVRCAHAAVTASSGAANSLEHPAQRIYREALVYTVSAQTTPIMEATLNRLVRSGQVRT